MTADQKYVLKVYPDAICSTNIVSGLLINYSIVEGNTWLGYSPISEKDAWKSAKYVLDQRMLRKFAQ